MPIRRRHIYQTLLTGAVVGVAASFYALFGDPEPLAVGHERSDGHYVVLDMMDERFEWACIAHFHYGEISKPAEFDCGDCAISPATRSVVALDEGGPVRLAVWRQGRFEAYEIDGDLINSSDGWGPTCTDRAVAVARCSGPKGERCAYRFADRR